MMAIMTRRNRKTEAVSLPINDKQTHYHHRPGHSTTKLYSYKRMKILLAIAAGFCFVHLIHCSGNIVQESETTTRSATVIDTTRKQDSVTPFTEPQSMETTSKAPPINPDNKMTTILTIFKIQKNYLHNISADSNSSSEQSWLIDSSSPIPTTAGFTEELPQSSPVPLDSADSSTISPATVTFASSSRMPPVLRPSIEEVASKLSRKHLNLEHNNWRIRQLSSSSPPSQSMFDDTTKLADGSTFSALSPIEAEQDVEISTSSSSANDTNPKPERGAFFSKAPSSAQTVSEVQLRDHYLNLDTVATSSPASVINHAKSRQPGSGRRKKGASFTGEAFELSQCYRYLRVYNAGPGSSSAGLYQMISNQQLPCSCEMRSYSYSISPIGDNERQSSSSVAPTSWLSCDFVQLIGAYLSSQSSSSTNSSLDSATWDMGKVAAGPNIFDGSVQVTRFSQRNSGLQTLHAQKFLNLQLSNLRSIDLSDNRLRQIKMDAFHGLEMSLENLNLANNLLGDSRAISYDSEQSQTKSKLIFLTDELNRLKKLKWLSLKNNRINQLSPTIFTRQSMTSSASFIQQQDDIKVKNSINDITGELMYLDLSENLLKSVPSDAIISLDKLETLNLNGNKISQLDKQSKFPRSLRHLDLSWNLIKTISNCDLIDLSDLTELNLSHNQLSQLDKAAFLSSSATLAGSGSLHHLSSQTNLDAATRTNHVESPLSSDNLIAQVAPDDSDITSLFGLASGRTLEDQTSLLERKPLEQPEVQDSVSDNLMVVKSERTRTRTRRDAIDRADESATIMDADTSDDLEAEESNLSSSIVTNQQQQQQITSANQQTLVDDHSANGRRGEFNSTISLNLAYNYFTSLPGDSLLKFPNLKRLDLSYNRVRNLDSNYLCSIYNLVESLQELDLSGNLLNLPQTSKNSTKKSSSLSTTSADKQVVENEGATTTRITSGRQLNRLFGCLQKLEKLSLGSNRLGSQLATIKSDNSVPDEKSSPEADEDDEGELSDRPKTVSSSDDRLYIRFGDNFGSRHLNQLDLSDNQLRTMPLIEQVFQQPINPMTTKRENSSESVSANDQYQHQLNQWMASRVYLIGLNMSYNYIDRLEERDFDHLFSLRQLAFDFNRLSSLPAKLMRKFTSLDRASFDGNRLSSLEPINELFERSIRTLRYLNLANNRLTVWPAINKVAYENPLRQEYVPLSIQIDSEAKQASALQFALEELNLQGNLLTSSNVSNLFDQFTYMKSLKILNLSQNLLQRVRSEWFKFANYNLRELSLAGNKINSIDLGSFAYNQLNELQRLDLNHNLLKELKRKTFDSLPKLRSLDLSYNLIHGINSESFNQMQSMQMLNLSNNKLSSWKCEYFSNLCNSISGNINADLNALLNLNQNQHPASPNNDLQRPPVSALIELDLSHNFLSQLRVNSISVHTKLERLNLAYNKLSYIPHDLFKANILDSKTGRQIQLVSSLKYLNLAHNRIQTVDNINLRSLRNLINFDLSHNELQTLGIDVILVDTTTNNIGNQRDRTIVVSSNATNSLINNIQTGSDANVRPQQTVGQQSRQSKMMQQAGGVGLPALGKLRHLNLSNNQLTQVNQSLLHELSPFVLINLDLSNNYLESASLPYGFYAKIPGPVKQADPSSSQPANNYDLVFTLKLESLDLSHNRLSDFPADLLDNHHISMESCNLAHNRMQTLVANSNILIQIKSLNLEFNPLNRESNELILFEHKSARHLNLAATRLFAIKEVTQSLAQASNLDRHKHRLVANQTSQLDLIRSISKPIDAPYVQHLNLSSNQLVWLAANIFERMHSLQTLDLSNNQLTRLHLLANQLSPLSASLESLNLASNLFTNIDSTDFSQLTRLQHLDLSSLLSLQKLNCRFLSKLTTLRSLRLFNFPQVRQNLNNILANLFQRRQNSHAFGGSETRMSRKLQQELLMSSIGRHCFRDEPFLEPDLIQQHQGQTLKWFNLQELELELFNTFHDYVGDSDDHDHDQPLPIGDDGRGGFKLQDELNQLLGPEMKKLTLFGLNLTNLADDSLLGITSQRLDLKISYTSLARLPLEQVLNGISKRTKLNLDFRNNNIQSLDVKSLQILDELQLNNQILQRGDHSSLRLASNPMRCDCQTRPLWLWLNQRWANVELPPSQPLNQLDEQAAADLSIHSSGGANSANYWLKFSSVSQTSDIKCHYPAKLRGKLAQYVNYHDLVCKGSSSNAAPVQSGRQSRKRNETRAGSELSYYATDFEADLGGSEASADYLEPTVDASSPDGALAPIVRVTKFNRFPSMMFNQTIYYMQNIPVPFILDDHQDDQEARDAKRDPHDLEPDSVNTVANRMAKRDQNSANIPIYPILNDRQIVNTRYSKHRPNTQQRHSSFDTLSTLKQFQPTHYHSGQKQTLLTELDVYILTIMSIAMSIMSLVIITICLLKYKMDRSDKERILTDHGKMLMSQALFSINNDGLNQRSKFKIDPRSRGSSSNNSSSKKSSSSSGSSSSNREGNSATKRSSGPQTIPMVAETNKNASSSQVLMPKQLRPTSPSSMVIPAAAQNFLMRSPTIRRMQGLATNASDWFKYTLRAYPGNTAMHRGHERRRRLFLGGDMVPIASQLTTGKQGIEQQLSPTNEPGSPATLAIGCPHHAFKAVDKLKDQPGRGHNEGVIEERCLHCARLLATIQQTKVQYLVGAGNKENSPKQQADEKDQNQGNYIPPSVIRALAEQLDQANAESNYVAIGSEWRQKQQSIDREASADSHHKQEQRVTRPMRTFGVTYDHQTTTFGQSTGSQDVGEPSKGSQIPSVDVIGRFAYQSDSQVDTPTPCDARCSSMLGGSSQMDGSEDTNGHYTRDEVFILVPDDSSDDDNREPTSVLLNKKPKTSTTTNEKYSYDTTRSTDHREDSIRMQDECSRSSSPVAYGFMRNSGPSSLASSGAARLVGDPQSNHHRYSHLSNNIRGQHNPTSKNINNNNNNNDIIDEYSVVRKKRDEDSYFHQHTNIGPEAGKTNNPDDHQYS